MSRYLEILAWFFLANILIVMIVLLISNEPGGLVPGSILAALAWLIVERLDRERKEREEA